jgi:amylosucrase
MEERFKIGPCCAWVNYVRSHDDIGWTFDDAAAARLGIDGFGHRRFLNAFYTGRFDGSFARGLPFQENPRTGDARISGTAASLAGLEKALREGREQEIEVAIRRIHLIYGVCISIGGIPLIYLGDEVGTTNDYTFRTDPARAGDSRWVHRPFTDWKRVSLRTDPATVEGKVYSGLLHLIDVRKGCSAFAGNEMEIIEPGNEHVFGYVRHHDGERMLALANFSAQSQTVGANTVRLYGLSYSYRDLVTGEEISLNNDLVLEPYRFVWLVPSEE